LAADAYVLAAGMQSRALGESAGLSLPIYPLICLARRLLLAVPPQRD